ncbi:MAG: glucose 1-dehydrogenase [Chitinophagales bacterium]|nr:glucose 1-dehydrogenase [Bacteroidota bacterium]MBK8487843.1 glucose 1-dehydrogenase [Bacteroidota bacterium]MBK8682401.1 glucose 1-dehydrogenase [Bacteroidota bacterium]MBP8917372.1 glucose 1-dehydrogenase [Chitinophagales bacterium]MBP9190693.1 glucose 1-dehydrogenase [Chitinophagales bacterium]
MIPSSLFDLTGKTAIVTGGGNGIGKASCKLLAAYGANVVVSDYNSESANAVVKEIQKEGGNAIAIDCDVTKDEELVQLVEGTLKAFGQINILVNNVGGGGAGKESPSQIKVDQFKKVFEMNVFSMWRMCQLVAPHMQESGYGSIINMSSMASINSSPAISAYASSKAAINHMTRNLAFDFGPVIRINAIGPGAIHTDALAKVLTPEIEKKMLAHTPLQRLGKPEDIAGAVLYFASPISNWVSGQVLFVNGGGVQTLD